MRKTLIGLLTILALFTVVACSKETKETDLYSVMDTVYEGLYNDVPSTRREALNDENIEYYLGTKIDYVEGLASEPDMSSIAHSVVLVKVKDVSKMEEIKKQVQENLNPNKWVCVGVAEIKMASSGDILLVVMDDEVGDKMISNFKNI